MLDFDREKLKFRPLVSRQHDMNVSEVKPLVPVEVDNRDYFKVAKWIKSAKQKSRPIILMMGAHVIRSGVQRYIIDLMERGYITCISMNGAGLIHDYEIALIGATTENVKKYIKQGQFGLWKETGKLNDIIVDGHKNQLGLGEAVGKALLNSNYPHIDMSLLATAYRLNIPVTAHVGIGFDIIHQHPNCDGAATGATSYRDFLRFAAILEMLEGGVLMNFGSAVTGPEVFLKALSMARNIAHQNGNKITEFTTLVCDLIELPRNWRKEPPKDKAAYYFRPLKTLLIRTVSDGGRSYYIRGKHATTIPALWSAIGGRK